ncbi:MJ0307 family thioredoxin [Methanobrevibacter sp. OttesenSCG-928-K11]|nr:MJ0307 family thioredoxin [Methanobrevibacter sp. OttesenSCG-928-K11]MDL2270472.1 MJ0307 family thioredoxin [Methanobrevibacter sp. OttesenSCG-928-I08]
MVTKIEVFTTDSCPHCPAAIKVAEEAKQELNDIELEIIKIVDNASRERAIDYGIMAVPTIVINKEVTFTGAPTKEELFEKLKSLN